MEVLGSLGYLLPDVLTTHCWDVFEVLKRGCWLNVSCVLETLLKAMIRPGPVSTKRLRVVVMILDQVHIPVHIIIFIMILKAKLILDQHSYTETLSEYRPWA